MPGYHNRKKKLYKMGGEMDSYKKGGKMPSWLVEMFKKKAKKSMNLGGNLTGKPVIREGREPIESTRVDPYREKGEKKNRLGFVVRNDGERDYHVKKGLFNETEYYQHSDGTYSPVIKNRTPLGKFFTGSDAKASFGDGGKVYYVTGGELDIDPRAGGGQPEKKVPPTATPPEDDVPAFDPNASWVKAAAATVEDDRVPGDLILDGARLTGPEGGRLTGYTMPSETTQRVGGFEPTLYEATRVAEEPKMTKEIVKKEEPDPEREPTPDPIPTRTPEPTPIPEPEPEPVPVPRTPFEGMTYANVGSYFNPGGERVYRDYGDGDVRAVGDKSHGGEGDRRDLIPTGLRGDDGKAHYASRDVYKMMEAEGIDPYSPEAAMFMEDAYKSNPELFGTNYHDSEVMRHRMLHADKGITHAGREGRDEGYFFPDQLFGRMHPKEAAAKRLEETRAQQQRYKEAEAERKRKAAEQREKDIAEARARNRRMGGGGRLYHFGS